LKSLKWLNKIVSPPDNVDGYMEERFKDWTGKYVKMIAVG